jgi:hypothetical protein
VRERPSPSTAVSAYYLPNVAAAYGAGRPVCGAALVLELMPAELSLTLPSALV